MRLLPLATLITIGSDTLRPVSPDLTLPSGIGTLDRLLMGGLHDGQFTHVFGEAASGKTTLALQFVSAACGLGMRTILVNSESSSPIERLEQITGKEFRSLEDSVRILVPKDFDEQATVIDDLELYARTGTGLVVIDTLTRLYRVVAEDKKSAYAAHRELNRQAGVLKGLAKQRGMAVLVLNQVRGRVDQDTGFEPVARNIMEYWGDCDIKMHVGGAPGERVLERVFPEGDYSKCILYMTSSGFTAVRDEKKQ